MAARRVTKVNIDWTALGERVPEQFRPQFLALKSRVETNLRKVTVLPEKPPAIDWAFYKSRIPKAAMVDTFQKKYEALQIPFPVDTVTAKINEHQKEIENTIKAESAEFDKIIKESQEQLAYLKEQLPVTQMTYQELAEAYPKLVVDAVNDPTPWPHVPEEIEEYKAELAAKGKGNAPSDAKAH